MTKTKRLEEYFFFSQDDLRENRKGAITEDQRLVLKEKTQRDTNVLLIFFIGSGIVYVAVNYIFDLGPGSMTISAVLGIMFVAVIILRRVKRSDQSLQHVEGAIEFFWEEHTTRDANNSTHLTTTKTLYLMVGEKKFQVREDLMDILDQGDRCRFYYTGGGDIISAEVISRQ